jgi:hypothetical protein
MHAALHHVDYDTLLPFAVVRVGHRRFESAADLGGVFRAFFMEWLENEAQRLCPGETPGVRMPLEDIPETSLLATQRNRQQQSWEIFGKVIGLCVLHQGFAAWPTALDSAILTMAIARHQSVKYRPATRYFSPDSALVSVFHLLDRWATTPGARRTLNVPPRIFNIIAHVFGISDVDAQAILSTCTSQEACEELGTEMYWEYEWKQRQGILAAFTKGLHWNDVL